MVNASEERIIMDKKIDKAEFAARQPDSAEYRSICHAMFFSALKKAKLRRAEGDEVLAREWEEAAEAIEFVSCDQNPNFKPHKR